MGRAEMGGRGGGAGCGEHHMWEGGGLEHAGTHPHTGMHACVHTHTHTPQHLGQEQAPEALPAHPPALECDHPTSGTGHSVISHQPGLAEAYQSCSVTCGDSLEALALFSGPRAPSLSQGPWGFSKSIINPGVSPAASWSPGVLWKSLQGLPGRGGGGRSK